MASFYHDDNVFIFVINIFKHDKLCLTSLNGALTFNCQGESRIPL